MHFTDLNLIDPLLRAVHDQGYTEPTPIQAQAIPQVLQGRDLIGCAQTGTGKTAAFALPVLQHLYENPTPRKGRKIRALVLSPTRELAAQIGENFTQYSTHTNLTTTVVFGGVGQNPQVKALRRHPDVLVATPGRLLDLLGQGVMRLDGIEFFVLDEADRMLDMGFIHDVRCVLKVIPKQRQTLLFSATMPSSVQELADSMLTNPVRVEVTPQSTTVEAIDQSVFFVNKKDKKALLEHIIVEERIERALVFTRTKHGANKLAQHLDKVHIDAEAIHGNKSQTARQKALANFKAGKTRVLVATDIASRGIDVDDVTHVINFDLPNEPESYVHRIGRTARAGASGVAYSFCDTDERKYLRDIEKLIRLRVPVAKGNPYNNATLGSNGESPESDGSNGSNGSSNGSNSNRSKRSRNRNRGNGGYSGNSGGSNGNSGNGGQSSSGQRRRRRNRGKGQGSGSSNGDSPRG